MDFSKYELVYNAAAHFAAIQKYPGNLPDAEAEHPDGLADAIMRSGLPGFEATCWALELLSTQGELIRRDMGYDPGETIREAWALLHLSPFDALEAKRRIMQAVSRGLRAHGDENEEVDEVLAELQKKTGSA